MTRILTKDLKTLNCKIMKIINTKMPEDIHVNATQMQIVTYLFRHEGEEVCQKDLEAETHLKKASITGALDSLEEEGIIVRKQSIDDKRRNIIEVTSKAEKHKQHIVSAYTKINKLLIKGLTDEDIENLYRIIDRMSSNLDREVI